MLKAEVREKDMVVIAELAGRLTMGSGDQVLHDLVDDLLASGWRQIILNLAAVEYMDSSGVGEMVDALRVTRAMSGRLKVVCKDGHVYDTLSVARLLPLFEVFASEDEAISSFAAKSDSRSAEILLEVDERVAVVTLNRARRFNALTRTMLSELISTLTAIRNDDTIRVMIITGAGRAFCFGADAEELREGTGALPTLELFQTVIRDLAELPKPVIGAINGFATGAGLDLALACDLRIIAKKAKLASGFVNFGLVPDGGSTFHLPRLVGHARAADLVLTGRSLDAEEALDWGIVNRVVASTAVLDEARKMARELATGPRRAIGRAKALLRGNRSTRDLATALTAEAAAQELCFGEDEFKEGLHAHLEKRDPCFPD